jgi:ATPase subunit of ABC transporter with duplicated ATPase domains
MSPAKASRPSTNDPRPLLEVAGATISAPGGRTLFEGLHLRLERGCIALVGRNGVGKSMLLAHLAEHASGPHLVPQMLGIDEAARNAARALARIGRSPPSRRVLTAELRAAGIRRSPEELARAGVLSHGELRKLALVAAKTSGAAVLLLDEPTDDLDEVGVAWLKEWLAAWTGCAVVASHDRRLLEGFRHFFVARESGCRYVEGTLAELDVELERDHAEGEKRYVAALHDLAAHEAHTMTVARRKARKKRFGRCRELEGGTPRARLNQKRDYAQVNHGKLAKIREARLHAVRAWSQSTRRALAIDLPFSVPAPTSAEVSEEAAGARERLAVVGPNGAGKTTLLAAMRAHPPTGLRVSGIAQAGTDWMLDASLYEELAFATGTPETAAAILVAHKFPIALGARPLRSLSPGERVRAALICLYQRASAFDVLVLDEPTFGLDLLGQRALVRALAAWPGGLVVASHDRAFLEAVGFDRWLELDGDGLAS